MVLHGTIVYSILPHVSSGKSCDLNACSNSAAYSFVEAPLRLKLICSAVDSGRDDRLLTNVQFFIFFWVYLRPL